MVAPRILWRYILRDSFLHTLLGLGVITLLLVVQTVLRVLEDLVSAGVPLSGVFAVVGILLPSYLPFAVPAALLFGVLLSFGRMSADGEIVAMRASGVSVPGLLPPVLALAAICAGLSAYLTWEVEPQSRHLGKLAQKELLLRAVLEPGKFNQLGPFVLYFREHGEQDCLLRGVMVSDLSNDDRTQFVSAPCARLVTSDDQPDIEFELHDGTVHFSDADVDSYRLMRFESGVIPLDPTSVLDRSRSARELSLMQALDARRRLERGERIIIRTLDPARKVDVQIHRQLSSPLASLLFAVIAVPLGIRPVRTGRSAGALTAVAVIGLYWLLTSAGERLASEGQLPVALGMWLPTAILAGLGYWLLRRSIRGEA